MVWAEMPAAAASCLNLSSQAGNFDGSWQDCAKAGAVAARLRARKAAMRRMMDPGQSNMFGHEVALKCAKLWPVSRCSRKLVKPSAIAAASLRERGEPATSAPASGHALTR